jgi:sugar phosphate isomerase/epimerase
MSIRWGKQVGELSQVVQAAAEGFDFVQPVGSLVADMSGEQLLQHKERVAAEGLPFAACAVPLPAEVHVTQRGFNLYAWMEHLKRTTHRMADLGCKKLLWSDGRARVLPVEGELTGLKEQVLQFLFMLCEVAANFQITVLVEPLGPRRTNLLNSMQEVGEFLPRVGKQNLASLISLRELEPIGLPLARLVDHRALIQYVHMENPQSHEGSRVSPRPSDGCDYRPFLRALKAMGYSGEIGLPSDSDAAALAYCRQLWEQT